MIHRASPSFWDSYNALPANAREIANKSFDLLKADPKHPSLHFKKVGKYRSVRAGRHYRALGVDLSDGVLWFWIGSHAEYDSLTR